MKTVFVCPSLNLRVEGLDNRPYSVNERITLKHQGRWLPMIVDDVREQGDIRQVLLKVNSAPDSVYLRRGTSNHSRQPKRPASPRDRSWIDGLVARIEGGKGPVRW